MHVFLMDEHSYPGALFGCEPQRDMNSKQTLPSGPPRETEPSEVWDGLRMLLWILCAAVNAGGGSGQQRRLLST